MTLQSGPFFYADASQADFKAYKRLKRHFKVFLRMTVDTSISEAIIMIPFPTVLLTLLPPPHPPADRMNF